MILDFIKTGEWQQIKELLKSATIDNINDVKLEGKTNDQIATEIMAINIANKKILKGIARVERFAKTQKIKTGSFK